MPHFEQGEAHRIPEAILQAASDYLYAIGKERNRGDIERALVAVRATTPRAEAIRQSLNVGIDTSATELLITPGEAEEIARIAGQLEDETPEENAA